MPVARPQSRGPPPPARPLAPPKPRSASTDALGRGKVQGPKLRTFFWETISKPPAESVWHHLIKPAEFDQPALEKLFAIAAPSAVTAAAGGTPGGQGRNRASCIRVLDDRSSRIYGIAFSKLPPPEQVAEMVGTLEKFPNGLPAEAVVALNECVLDNDKAVGQIRQLESEGADLLQLDMPSLVNDTALSPSKLCEHLETLLVKFRAAQTVSLEEVEKTCRKLVMETGKVQNAFAEVSPVTPEVARLAEEIQRMVKHANFAASLVEKVKSELSSTMAWSCTKTNSKSEDFFCQWRRFLEQLLRSLSQAKPPPLPLSPAKRQHMPQENSRDACALDSIQRNLSGEMKAPSVTSSPCLVRSNKENTPQ